MSDEYFAYKPIRVLLSGDKTAAKGLVRAAKVQSAKLDHSMSFQGLKQGKSTVETEDYTIVATTTFNERKVEIYHKPGVTEEETSVLETCECALNFAECEIVGISRDANGDIPQFGDYDEYCVCYDTLICGPEGMTLWERVRPSDFTRYQPGDKAVIVFEGFFLDFYREDYGSFLIRVGKTSCDGFSANEMNPDHVDYIHPTILPCVMKDEHLEEISYLPVIAQGIMPTAKDTLNDDRMDLTATDADGTLWYYIHTGGALEAYGNSLYNGYPLYPTVNDDAAFGISCSIHGVESSDYDSDIYCWGDCFPSLAAVEYETPHGAICYRNRGYLETATLSQQLIGGSFAFDCLTKAIYLSTRRSGIVIFSPGESDLGNIPDGSIAGETVGRKCLMPATKWLIKKFIVGPWFGEQESYYVGITDIRTGDWSTDVWALSTGVFTRLSAPSTPFDPGDPSGLSDSQLSLFRQMFVYDEFRRFHDNSAGDIHQDDQAITPEVLDELSSFTDITVSSIDIDPDDCSVSPATVYTSALYESRNYDWYVNNATTLLEYDFTLVTIRGTTRLAGITNVGWDTESSYHTGGIYSEPNSFPKSIAYQSGPYQSVDLLAEVVPPPPGALQVSLCFEDVSPGGSGDAFTTTSTDIISSFTKAATEFPDPLDPYCEAESGAVMFAEYDYSELDYRDRFSIVSTLRYRYYESYTGGVGTAVGTQINEGEDPSQWEPDASFLVRDGCVWKSNFMVSGNSWIYPLWNSGAGAAFVEYGAYSMTGCYYPVLVLATDTPNSQTELDTRVHMCPADTGFKSFSHDLECLDYNDAAEDYVETRCYLK